MDPELRKQWEKKLTIAYHNFNRRKFDNYLTQCPLVRIRSMRSWATGGYGRVTFSTAYLKRFDIKECRAGNSQHGVMRVLLHEMVHVEQTSFRAYSSHSARLSLLPDQGGWHGIYFVRRCEEIGLPIEDWTRWDR